MQANTSRWRELATSRTEKSMLETSRSTSNNRKFTPVRRQNNSQFHKKIVQNNQSRLESSTDGGPPKENLFESRRIIQKAQSKQQASPIKSQKQSMVYDSSIRFKQLQFSNQELQSPTIILKQLNKIKKIQCDKNPPPTRVLFSLDQEHRFIHEELHRVKTDFLKFKELIEAQLMKQQIFMKNVVGKILKEFERVLQICNTCSERINIENVRFDTYKEVQAQYIDLNLPQISTIQQLESPKDFNLKKLSRDDSINFQRLFSTKANEVQSQHLPDLQARTIYTPKHYQRLHTSRSEMASSQITVHKNLGIGGNVKARSKKQFQKLFEAVNCLKRDIKDLKELSFEKSKDEGNSEKKKQYKTLKNRLKEEAEVTPNSPRENLKDKFQFHLNRVKN